MEPGGQIPSAAPPPDEFARALSAFHEAQAGLVAAREAVDLAQVEQAAAINALPAAEQADMARLEEIADRLQINQLGAAALDRLNEAAAALEALIAVPAPTSLALFEKLAALADDPWSPHHHMDRLLADAGTLSLQFAEVWLGRWIAHGGTVMIDADDAEKAWIGFAEWHLTEEGQRHRDGAGPDPEIAGMTNRSWLDGRHHGRMRELHDLLSAMPGGVAAVKAIVTANPARGLSSTAAEAAEGEAGR